MNTEDPNKEHEELIKREFEIQRGMSGLDPLITEMLTAIDRIGTLVSISRATELPLDFIGTSLLEAHAVLETDNLDMKKIPDRLIVEAFVAMDHDVFAKEGLPDVLAFIAREPEEELEDLDMEDVAGYLGFLPISEVEARIVAAKAAESSETLDEAVAAALQVLRGRMDGDVLSEIVQEYWTR